MLHGSINPMPDSSVEHRFAFYERVRITSDRPELAPIRGELAAVLGRAEGEVEPGYAVSVYATGECWDVTESDLEPTGEMDRREAFYPGESVRVSVKPDGTGRVL